MLSGTCACTASKPTSSPAAWRRSRWSSAAASCSRGSRRATSRSATAGATTSAGPCVRRPGANGRRLLQPLDLDVRIAVAVAGDGELPGLAAHLAVLHHAAPDVRLDGDLDALAAVGALHLDRHVPVAVAAQAPSPPLVICPSPASSPWPGPRAWSWPWRRLRPGSWPWPRL